MKVENLRDIESGSVLETDLLIIGGGAVGLTIAREFMGTPWKVTLIESGDKEQTEAHEKLNEVELDSSSVPETWLSRRDEYHGHQAELWSGDVQRFGVRCRGLGGSTAAWAGKSACFSEQDFVERPWLEQSGWPITRDEFLPYLRRGEKNLNLGVGKYGNDFWEGYTGRNGKLDFDPKVLTSFFWQFARSRINPSSMMRMGPEFQREKADNINVLLNATAMSVLPNDKAETTETVVKVAAINGEGNATLKAHTVVLCCGALENARLLLSSKAETHPEGLGNQNDNVGRYLMDHMNARVVQFDDKDVKPVSEMFGFYGISSPNRVDMYMHGLELQLPIQAEEELVNVGAYVVADRAEDDPWGAVAGLVRGQSKAPFKDILSIITAPGLMITGAGRLFLQSDKVPAFIKKPIVDICVKLFPNFVVEEYQTQGIPHKIVSAGFDAITEQEPMRENRVVLSEKTNSLGQQLPKVVWEPGERALKSIMRMGHHISDQFAKAGLPVPKVADWIAEGRIEDAPIIDTAHTSGTTRMSVDPAYGVVDENCKIHGVDGVYVAGGSILPTCGHANPTLMITSMAIRLSDHLKENFKISK